MTVSEPAEVLEAQAGAATKEESQRSRSFNGLTAREWTGLSRNVWTDLSSPRTARHLEHGAVFPVRLAERLITLYSREGDLVFDPFVGIGSTLVAARGLGRPSIGIELNPRFAGLARQWLMEDAEQHGEIAARVVNADCRQMRRYLKPDSVQVTVTSPPYADFIQRSTEDRARTHKKSRLVLDNNSRVKQYSGDRRDVGNLAYESWLKACRVVLQRLLSVTRPGGYAVWVVKDHRLPPEMPYVPMHSDLATEARRAGWRWHDLIMWDQNDQRRLVLLGYPSKFYTNQNSSFLVVLRKDG